MPIPTYDQIMLPMLDFIKDGKPRSMAETIDYMADYFKLSSEERLVMIPSGQSSYIRNRTGWCRTYLHKAGLIFLPERGYVQITQQGLDVLAEKPKFIDVKYLKRFSGFLDFRTYKKEPNAAVAVVDHAEQLPEDMLYTSYEILRKNLADELLEQIKKSSPRFFEQLVIDVLLAMGYGGSRTDAGKLVGGAGDGGIDGIINEDKLGLDVIYLQAKRWEGVVGSKEIRNFVGSLVGRKANKGVFITTSSYTKDAIQYAADVQHKVILIDGDKLVDLMIEYNVGVSKEYSYEIKKIDLDYFEE
ncbi:MAG: restriction endonuclease [Gammaproteobacteria bacterium]|nr:restriction endonuclease [Gammaproteobacteria bacterium]